MFSSNNVNCKRTMEFYDSRKVMRLIITADTTIRFNLIVELSLTDEVLEWAFDKSVDLPDAIYYESRLRRFSDNEIRMELN
jgi:hypothetical protein